MSLGKRRRDDGKESPKKKTRLESNVLIVACRKELETDLNLSNIVSVPRNQETPFSYAFEVKGGKITLTFKQTGILGPFLSKRKETIECRKVFQFFVDPKHDVGCTITALHTLLYKEYDVPHSEADLLIPCKDLIMQFNSHPENKFNLQAEMVKQTPVIRKYPKLGLFCWLTCLGLALTDYSLDEQHASALLHSVIQCERSEELPPRLIQLIFQSLEQREHFPMCTPKVISRTRWSQQEFVTLIRAIPKEHTLFLDNDSCKYFTSFLVTLCPATAESVTTLSTRLGELNDMPSKRTICSLLLRRLISDENREELCKLCSDLDWLDSLIASCSKEDIIRVIEMVCARKLYQSEVYVELFRTQLYQFLIATKSDRGVPEEFLELWNVFARHRSLLGFAENEQSVQLTKEIIFPVFSQVLKYEISKHEGRKGPIICQNFWRFFEIAQTEKDNLIHWETYWALMYKVCESENLLPDLLSCSDVKNLSKRTKDALCQLMIAKLSKPMELPMDYYAMLGAYDETSDSFLPHNKFCVDIMHLCGNLFIGATKITIPLQSFLHTSISSLAVKYGIERFSDMKKFVECIVHQVIAETILVKEFVEFTKPTNPNHTNFFPLLRQIKFSESIVNKIKNYMEVIRQIQRIAVAKEKLRLPMPPVENMELRVAKEFVIDESIFNFEKTEREWTFVIHYFQKYKTELSCSSVVLGKVFSKYNETIVKRRFDMLPIPFEYVQEITDNFRIFEDPEQLIELLMDFSEYPPTSTETKKRIHFCYQSKHLLSTNTEFMYLLTLATGKTLEISYFKPNFVDTSLPTLDEDVIDTIKWIYTHVKLEHFGVVPAVSEFIQSLRDGIVIQASQHFIPFVNSICKCDTTKQLLCQVDLATWEISLYPKLQLLSNNGTPYNLKSKADFIRLIEEKQAISLLQSNVGEIDEMNDIQDETKESLWPMIAGRCCSLLDLSLHIGQLKELSEARQQFPFLLFTPPELTQLAKHHENKDFGQFSQLITRIVPKHSLGHSKNLLPLLEEIIPGNLIENEKSSIPNVEIKKVSKNLDFANIIRSVFRDQVLLDNLHSSNIIFARATMSWDELSARLQRIKLPSITFIVIFYAETLSTSTLTNLFEFLYLHAGSQRANATIHLIMDSSFYAQRFGDTVPDLFTVVDIPEIKAMSNLPVQKSLAPRVKVYYSDAPGVGKSEMIYSDYKGTGVPIVVADRINKEQIIESIRQAQDCFFPMNFLRLSLYPIEASETELNEFLFNLLVFHFIQSEAELFPIFKNDPLDIVVEVQGPIHDLPVLHLFDRKQIQYHGFEKLMLSRPMEEVVQRLCPNDVRTHEEFIQFFKLNFEDPSSYLKTQHLFKLMAFVLRKCRTDTEHENLWPQYCYCVICNAAPLSSELHGNLIPYALESSDMFREDLHVAHLLRDIIESRVPLLLHATEDTGKTTLIYKIATWLKIPCYRHIVLSASSTKDNVLQALSPSCGGPLWVVFDEMQAAPQLFFFVYDIIMHRLARGALLSSNVTVIGILDHIPTFAHWITPFITNIQTRPLSVQRIIAGKQLQLPDEVVHCLASIHTLHGQTNPRLISWFHQIYQQLLSRTNSADPCSFLSTLSDSEISEHDVIPFAVFLCTFVVYLAQSPPKLQYELKQELGRTLRKPESFFDDLLLLNEVDIRFKDLIPQGITLHHTLKENLLILCSCVSAHIPVCLSGAPGSSKTTAVFMLKQLITKCPESKFLLFSGRHGATIEFFQNILEKASQWKKDNPNRSIVIVIDDTQTETIQFINAALGFTDLEVPSYSLIVLTNATLPEYSYRKRLLVVYASLPSKADFGMEHSHLLKKMQYSPEVTPRRFYSAIQMQNFVHERDGILCCDFVAPRFSVPCILNFIGHYVTSSPSFYVAVISSDPLSGWFSSKEWNKVIPYEIFDCSSVSNNMKDPNTFKAITTIFSNLSKPMTLILENITPSSAILHSLYKFLECTRARTCKIDYLDIPKQFSVHPDFRIIFQMNTNAWDKLPVALQSRLQPLYLQEIVANQQQEIINWLQAISQVKKPVPHTPSLLEPCDPLDVPLDEIIIGYHNNLVSQLCTEAQMNFTPFPDSPAEQVAAIQHLLLMRMTHRSFMVIFSSTLNLSFEVESKYYAEYLLNDSAIQFIRTFTEDPSVCTRNRSLFCSKSTALFTYSSVEEIATCLTNENINCSVLQHNGMDISPTDRVTAIVAVTEKESILNFVEQQCNKQSLLIISIQAIRETQVDYLSCLSTWNTVVYDTFGTHSYLPKELGFYEPFAILKQLPADILANEICLAIPLASLPNDSGDKLEDLIKNSDVIKVWLTSEIHTLRCPSRNWILELGRSKLAKEAPFEVVWKQYRIHYIAQFIIPNILSVVIPHMEQLSISSEIEKHTLLQQVKFNTSTT